MLELTGLARAYDGFRLGPIDLTVEAEILAVLGPSGCGKTTLLSTIAGIEPADAGSVTLDGDRLDNRPPEARGTVMVFQAGALFPHMTARENIAYAGGGDANIAELGDTLEIGGILDQRAGTLSGGERQRVALARALAADPAALLLDEPLANLDAPIKRRLRDDLRDLLAPLDVPVIYVTHDQTEASSVGDRVAVMADGRLQQVGSPAAVFDRPATPFVARFTGGTNVYRASVDAGRLVWGSYRLDPGQVDLVGVSAAATGPVWFCVRPEHVELLGEAADSDGPSADRSNRITGRIEDRVYEGGTHRLTIRPDGVDATIDLTMLPPAYDRWGIGATDRVTIALPAGAIHVIAGSAEAGRPRAFDR